MLGRDKRKRRALVFWFQRYSIRDLLIDWFTQVPGKLKRLVLHLLVIA